MAPEKRNPVVLRLNRGPPLLARWLDLYVMVALPAAGPPRIGFAWA